MEATELLFELEFAKGKAAVYWIAEKQVMIIDSIGDHTAQDSEMFFEKFTNLIQNRRFERLVVNLFNLGTTTWRANQFASDHIGKQLLENGLKKCAFVTPNNIYGKIAKEEIIDGTEKMFFNTRRSFQIAEFATLESAMAWIAAE